MNLVTEPLFIYYESSFEMGFSGFIIFKTLNHGLPSSSLSFFFSIYTPVIFLFLWIFVMDGEEDLLLKSTNSKYDRSNKSSKVSCHYRDMSYSGWRMFSAPSSPWDSPNLQARRRVCHLPGLYCCGPKVAFETSGYCHAFGVWYITSSTNHQCFLHMWDILYHCQINAHTYTLNLFRCFYKVSTKSYWNDLCVYFVAHPDCNLMGRYVSTNITWRKIYFFVMLTSHDGSPWAPAVQHTLDSDPPHLLELELVATPSIKNDIEECLKKYLSVQVLIMPENLKKSGLDASVLGKSFSLVLTPFFCR